MFHPNTDLLIDYWRAKKRGAAVMQRSALDPEDLAPLLSRLLMAGRSAGGDWRLRMAGEGVAKAHHGARAGDDLLRLWRDADRPRLRRTLDAAMRNGAPFIAATEADLDDGGALSLEITFVPLVARGPIADRLLALYQPTSLARWRRFAEPLRLIDLVAIGGAPTLRLAAADGRLIA